MKLNEIRLMLDEPIAELVWNDGESKLVCPATGIEALRAKVNGELDDVLEEFGGVEVTHVDIVGNCFSIELDSSDGRADDALSRVVQRGLTVKGFRYIDEVGLD